MSYVAAVKNPEEVQAQLALTQNYSSAIATLKEAAKTNPILNKYANADELAILCNASTDDKGENLTPAANKNLATIKAKLAAMQEKLSAELGPIETAALLKKAYGENFDYATHVAPVRAPGEKAADSSMKFLSKLSDKDPVGFVTEHPWISLGIGACVVGLVSSVGDIWSKPGFGKVTAIAVTLLMGLGLYVMNEYSNKTGVMVSDNNKGPKSHSPTDPEIRKAERADDRGPSFPG